jgi:cell division protein FtsW
MNRWYARIIPHLIFCVTTCLVLFGLVMVYSSSAFEDYRRSSRSDWEQAVEKAVETATIQAGESNSGDEATATLETLRKKDAERRTSMLSTFLRQVRWGLVGFVFLALAAMVDYPIWQKKIGWVLLAFLGCQLALMTIPPDTGLPIQSRVVNGARSSLQILSFRFQPSEIAKLGVIVFTAWVLARSHQPGRNFFLCIVPGFFIAGVSVALILWESDKGVAGHLCIALLALWTLAGIKFRYIAVMGILATVAIGSFIIYDPEAVSRFFDSFQMRQAKAAFARGGLLGTGIGDGDADLAYLYAAHTDFILAVIGEELGFIASSLVVFGYLFLILLGLKVAEGCPDPFGTYLALGITVLIGTQAFLNIAVSTGMAPTTGFTLPLLSYGGSSLIWTMAGIGVLINISLSNPSYLLGNGKKVRSVFGTAGRVV